MRVYIEHNRKGEGPLTLERIMDKEAWPTDGQKTKRFNASQINPDPSDVAGRDISRLLSSFKEFKTGAMPGILLTKVINPGDNHNEHPMFDK